MVDLTNDFVNTSEHVWTEVELYEMHGSLTSGIPHVRLDWDDGVPEHWALLYTDDTVIGIVCTVVKIAVLMPACPRLIEERLRARGVAVVWATGWDTYDYIVDFDALKAAFPKWEWGDPAEGGGNAEPLSIHDIWFLSVA